jgi:putative transposase
MPRTARAAVGGMIYHVLNRGNGRQRIFHKQGDYAAFLKVLGECKELGGVEVLGWCLMPNHWHLVLRPEGARDLARFVGRLCTTHVRRYHQHHRTAGEGHLYQGRYRSFPIQKDRHLLTVLRYVEANALRAGMVERAEEWAWGSAADEMPEEGMGVMDESPVPRTGHWSALLNRPLREGEAESIRTSIKRGRPYGSEQWVKRTAGRLGLEHTLRARGRPRKKKAEK